VHHRYLELCVISQVANELKSGDLCSPLGDNFRDYRQQLVAWYQFEREVSAYGDQTGIPTEARQFVQSLQEKLIATSRNTDERFSQNESVRIENGEPISSPLKTSSLWKRGSKREWDTLISSTLSSIRSIGCTGLATLDHSLVMMPKSIACG
jgi:hypothetical protein